MLKGRIHSIKKILTMTQDEWEIIMASSVDLTLADFRPIILFQVWYKEQEELEVKLDDDLLCKKLNEGELGRFFDLLTFEQDRFTTQFHHEI